MRRRIPSLVLAAWLLLPGDAGVAANGWSAPEPQAPVVVLLSWDGIRHDYPDRIDTPGLARMARDGVRAGRLVPVFPSSTFPTHVSMATGTYPDRHGIIDNQFIEPGRGEYRYSGDADWLEAEPLWIAAERQGVPAATYFWVGSESDWRGRGTRYRVAPFDGSRSEAAKVAQILEWLALPEDERPRLIMSYWGGADAAGHRHGPDSSEVDQALRAQDAALRNLLAGIDAQDAWPFTTLIIVSDHGMAPVTGYIDLRGALDAAGIGARVTGSAVAQVYLDDPRQIDAALDVAAGLGNTTVYRRSELPGELRLGHPRRGGDLVVITEPPFTLSRPGGAEGALMAALSRLGATFGGHGYHPEHPDMGGIFFALGRGVERGLSIAEVHQTDVAATVAGLLGIEPPADSEGRAVAGIAEQALTHAKEQTP